MSMRDCVAVDMDTANDDTGAMTNNPLSALEDVIEARLATADPEASYVARLAAAGLPKIAQKLGEEATETVIAALSEGDEALVGEAADLVFHLTLLLRQRGLGWADVLRELDRRHGVSGLVEKAGRS
jgi:phosphoribosyl-ATP pyrophosphohydrolase